MDKGQLIYRYKTISTINIDCTNYLYYYIELDSYKISKNVFKSNKSTSLATFNVLLISKYKITMPIPTEHIKLGPIRLHIVISYTSNLYASYYLSFDILLNTKCATNVARM